MIFALSKQLIHWPTLRRRVQMYCIQKCTLLLGAGAAYYEVAGMCQTQGSVLHEH